MVSLLYGGDLRDRMLKIGEVINQCIKNGPNKGWWNGPDYGQFYEAGFRPLNGEGSKHEAFSGDSTLNGPVARIFPSRSDGTIDCAGGYRGSGARMSDCRSIVQDQTPNENAEFCTSSPDKACIRHGKTLNAKGEVLSSWCVIKEYYSCAFVIADKDPRFGGGLTGHSCISGQNLVDMSIKGAEQCDRYSPGTAVAAGPVRSFGVPAQALCLVSKDHPEVCAVH
ncbi:hypothetical protein EJ05DRAFT_152625 [Pseudovirgaria hyperparasitica]|uniref:Uncharacterized protein n=1 Tax=Pseudovirgaria hyperparasitica TaxID=470096 RepID=A0A6A6VY48_9PEZI|nr:uncharacterized protein EJ05DRAFT_152625 [Pseudovirgaria hyperparasitica]KAF2754207.1 hypothetical protein EJ05DRAFT_152625 [Pseudovirgaria hyperparasitica]